MTPPRARVLVVDDERPFADAVVEHLRDRGYAAEAAYDATSGIAAAHRTPPDVLVADIRMPGSSGFHLVEEVRRTAPACVVILTTAYAEMALAWLSTGIRADGFVPKPASLDDLLGKIEAALADREAPAVR